MKSSEAVFTRQNPFPPEPPLNRTHYSPSRAKKVPKQQRKLALSPDRFGQLARSPESPPQAASLSQEDQIFLEGSHRVVLCPLPSVQQHQSFSESWPSTDCASTTASSRTELQASQQQLAMASGTQEPSVLAKYIERFRYGRPQSRIERQRLPAGEVNVEPFWWISSSLPQPSSSTPTQTSKERFREPADCSTGGMQSSAKQAQPNTSLSPTRGLLDLSVLALSDSSHCESGEPEILQLQERASRLLQKSENSLSSVSSGIPISSEGLGCSDFSSPVSVDEPIRRPTVPSLMDSNLKTTQIPSGGYPFPAPPALGTRVPKTCPEDDILFQWRLRRKMEQARQWSQTSSHSSAFHQSLWNRLPQQPSPVSADPPQRAAVSLTPVCVDSPSIPAACPTLQPACPVSSATICTLHPESSIHTHDDRVTCSHSVPSPQPARERATPKPQTTCTFPQAHQTVRGSSSESAMGPCSKHQTASSQSPQLSESTGGEWRGCQSKEGLQAKDRPGMERGVKRTTASVQNKKTDRHTGSSKSINRKQCIAKVNDGHARGHTGVSNKSRVSNGESQSGGQGSARDIRSGDRAPPPSPIHRTLGQVVSEVMFPGTDSPTQPRSPASSEPHNHTPSPPPQSPAPPLQSMPQPSEVIDQLMQEAQDSDGVEFEDDPLLSVLRQQRKWVKEQLCEVDRLLDELHED